MPPAKEVLANGGMGAMAVSANQSVVVGVIMELPEGPVEVLDGGKDFGSREAALPTASLSFHPALSKVGPSPC